MNFNKKYLQLFLIQIILSLTFLEIVSRFILYQPVLTGLHYVQKNGLITNKNKGYGFHGWFNRKIEKYSYGGLYSRYSNDSKEKKVFDKKKCNILVLGDSFTFGVLIPYEKTFVGLLEEKLKKESNNSVRFHNSAVGGWGLADYSAFIEDFKKELAKFKGIIIFSNSDDARRAVISDNYYLNSSFKLVRNDNLKPTKIRNIIQSKYILYSHDLILRKSNLARLIRNIIKSGYPIKENINVVKKIKLGENLYNLKNQDKLIIKQIIEKINSNTKDIIPINFIYIGTSDPNTLSKVNQFFISKNGVQLLNQNNIKNDFSLIKDAPILEEKDFIRNEGHPNEKGHEKFFNNIISSVEKDNIKNFISQSCK